MELFDAKGCLSEEGLQALVSGQLDETQRLEAAEHLAYCDRCMDRYGNECRHVPCGHCGRRLRQHERQLR